MGRRTVLTIFAALVAASLSACMGSWSFEPTADFFPLKPNETWSYLIRSKSQRATYVMTDRVIGAQYVPALKLTGEVVEEYYNFDRAGLRPVVYYQQSGYFTRLSGLEFDHNKISAPAWGKSLDARFLPDHLAPNMSWSNSLFPYGNLPGGFEVTQTHKTYEERHEVDVPAGHFRNCIRVVTEAVYKGGAYADQKQPLKLAYVDWYAPNVGLVRTIAYQGGLNGPEMERVELIRFNDGSGRKSAKVAQLQPKSRRPSESLQAKAQ